MIDNNAEKKYKSLKIPKRSQVDESGEKQLLSQSKSNNSVSVSDEMYYEIEYDSGPIKGVGKFVMKPKPQKIEEPEQDAVRVLFAQMREIARMRSTKYNRASFFDRRVQKDNAMIFHRQGTFMKDFTDNYEGNRPFEQYFPYYQMLDYEQFRTYFTWRTQVRKATISDTSLSYAFLYIYELLGNIGVADSQDGLDKLTAFWKGFRVYNKTIDKYILRWLKDYHIYYGLWHTWSAFIGENGLAEYYPTEREADDNFFLYCGISRYDIRKSVFFTEENHQMITDCFSFVLKKIEFNFDAVGINFSDALFCPTKKLVAWKPFRDALFHNWLKQPDRRVVVSENEIYICKNNEWTFSTVITTENGRRFIGYVMKKMESVLRKITKYKYKLSANTTMINDETLHGLTKAGLYIDKIVPAAVLEYYKEATKATVTVNHDALARIREDALATQEALIVEEPLEQKNEDPVPMRNKTQDQYVFADSLGDGFISDSDPWDQLKEVLNENEIHALRVVLQGGDINIYAGECNIMTEVLVDGINEKAMDYIGDNLMDADFALYDDYIENVKELVK